jgi:broad specificity phosphatase PhoE
MALAYFVTHPEVVIDPRVPITEWELTTEGRARAEALRHAVWLGQIGCVLSSTERKAEELAEILAGSSGTEHRRLSDLGEIDRSSTGFLEPPEFRLAVDSFFAQPNVSFRGWETAEHARGRIVDTVRNAILEHGPAIAFASHGAVGALLLGELTGRSIPESEDQPGLGCYFAFDPDKWTAATGWVRY